MLLPAGVAWGSPWNDGMVPFCPDLFKGHSFAFAQHSLGQMAQAVHLVMKLLFYDQLALCIYRELNILASFCPCEGQRQVAIAPPGRLKHRMVDRY